MQMIMLELLEGYFSVYGFEMENYYKGIKNRADSGNGSGQGSELVYSFLGNSFGDGYLYGYAIGYENASGNGNGKGIKEDDFEFPHD